MRHVQARKSRLTEANTGSMLHSPAASISGAGGDRAPTCESEDSGRPVRPAARPCSARSAQAVAGRIGLPLLRALLLAFALVQSLAVAASPPPADGADDDGPGVCTVTGEQIAAAPVAEHGRPFGMRVRLAAECPPDASGLADIFLLIDISASMADSGKMDAARAAVREFVDNVDFERHRAGLIPFNRGAYVALPLTSDTDRLERTLAGLPEPSGGTDIASALEMARGELRFAKRAEAVGVAVLLTDGQSNEAGMLAAAENARRDGMVIFTIGLGPDAAEGVLRRTATSPEHYYAAPDASVLGDVYRRIAAMLREFSVTDVRLFDRPGWRVSISMPAGAAEPVRDGEALRWWRPFLTSDATEIEYEVRVDRTGRLTPSAELWVEYSDGDGLRRRADIEPAEVDVLAPSVVRAHLPFAAAGGCIETPVRADVVLGLDVSSSMTTEDKLERAVEAARGFVARLEVGASGHRVAIVSFSSEARLLAALTENRSAIDGALDTIATGHGTRLDLGLEVAAAALAGPRGGLGTGRRAAVIMLSDGHQTEDRTAVEGQAASARAMGIETFAVALGDDADMGLMGVVAGDAARLHRASDASALDAIYGRLAGAFTCR